MLPRTYITRSRARQGQGSTAAQGRARDASSHFVPLRFNLFAVKERKPRSLAGRIAESSEFRTRKTTVYTAVPSGAVRLRPRSGLRFDSDRSCGESRLVRVEPEKRFRGSFRMLSRARARRGFTSETIDDSLLLALRSNFTRSTVFAAGIASTRDTRSRLSRSRTLLGTRRKIWLRFV